MMRQTGETRPPADGSVDNPAPIPNVTMTGYRLQLTLVDLIDLTLQQQHLRWNLFDEKDLRERLDEFDALVRAAGDAVAARMRSLDLSPDGRVGTVYQDLLFDPLPAGPVDVAQAVAAFSRRLAQFGSRIRESLEVLAGSDDESADLLATISEEIIRWAEHFGSGVDQGAGES